MKPNPKLSTQRWESNPAPLAY